MKWIFSTFGTMLLIGVLTTPSMGQLSPPIPPNMVLEGGKAVFFEPSTALSPAERAHLVKHLNPISDRLPEFIRLAVTHGIVVSVKLMDKEYKIVAQGSTKPQAFTADNEVYDFKRFSEAVDKLVANINTQQVQVAPPQIQTTPLE